MHLQFFVLSFQLLLFVRVTIGELINLYTIFINVFLHLRGQHTSDMVQEHTQISFCDFKRSYDGIIPNLRTSAAFHPLFELFHLGGSETVGFGDERNHINFVLQGLHELHIHWTKPARGQEPQRGFKTGTFTNTTHGLSVCYPCPNGGMK